MLEEIKQQVEEKSHLVNRIRQEIEKVLVGQRKLVDGLLMGLLTKGHILIEGVPGLAKTSAVKSLAATVQADFKRIQFTPDLLPADLIGTEVFLPKTAEFIIKKGPIFHNIILADEINRAPSKVQSALLEAMQERQVTIGDSSFLLSDPFLVMATQNPIEQEGTYPLPEAQLDRFFFKLLVGYSNREQLGAIVDRTTRGEVVEPSKVMDGEEILNWQGLVREVIVAPHLQDYIVRLVLATHPDGQFALPPANKYIRWGASPRAAQTLALAAKVRALLDARYNISFEDVRRVYLPALRHRIIVNFEAQAEGIEPDQVLLEILEKVPEKAEG